jgi:hypothetical protein
MRRSVASYKMAPCKALSAISIAIGLTAVSAAAGQGEIQRKTRLTTAGIEVNVPTGGCTRRSDFSIEAVRTDGRASVVIRRRVPDECKGHFPAGTWIRFTWKELGLTPGIPVTVFEQDP